MKFFLLIIVKMPTIVGILKFVSRNNTIKVLLSFGDFDPVFKVTGEALDCEIFCVGIGVTDSCMHDIP